MQGPCIILSNLGDGISSKRPNDYCFSLSWWTSPHDLSPHVDSSLWLLCQREIMFVITLSNWNNVCDCFVKEKGGCFVITLSKRENVYDYFVEERMFVILKSKFWNLKLTRVLVDNKTIFQFCVVMFYLVDYKLLQTWCILSLV